MFLRRPLSALTSYVCFCIIGLGSLAQSGVLEESNTTLPTIASDKPQKPDLTLANLRRAGKKDVIINTKEPIATNSPEGAVYYRLNSDEGGTCILLRVDAIITFTYITTLNEKLEKNIFVPDNVIVNGDCSGDDQQILILKWKTFVLIFNFDKTPGGERWYVESVELKYDSTSLEHIKNPGPTYTLSTSNSHSQLLFPTPVGKSYWCDREIDIELDNPRATNTTATILLRDLKVEPFIFRNNFGPEFKCSAVGAGSFRSETAPFVVGSCLAAACLLTIAGYGLFRYFKIKKVQYDTME